MTRCELIEVVQRMAARLLATNREGIGLCLMGGFRYRLLDAGCRRSADLDYQCVDDLEVRQASVASLLRTRLLPEVKRRLDMEGRVSKARGPGADSASVKTVEIAIWRPASDMGLVEIPVDIMRIPCADKPVARTVDGVLYLAASDADMIESKILALFLRDVTAARDLVDLFFFHDRLAANAPVRLAAKLAGLKVGRAELIRKVQQMEKDPALYIKGIAAVVAEQIDEAVAENIRVSGGAESVFAAALAVVRRALGVEPQR